jgi:hypothetical protein
MGDLIQKKEGTICIDDGSDLAQLHHYKKPYDKDR